MDRTRTVTEWKSGLPETPCGRGSMLEETEVIREVIPQVIESCGIKSVADIGCGDQNWIHECLPADIEYVGFDIRPRRPDVQTFDVTQQVLPYRFDLVLCIYVLNHLLPARAEQALRLLKMSGASYLLMSYSDGDEYSLKQAGKLITSRFHKKTSRHTWHYGLWKMNG